MRFRYACAWAGIVSCLATINCSSDSTVGPGGDRSHATYTLALTSVSGARLPARFLADTVGGYSSWADSGTATVQADGVIALRLYESATAPVNAPHQVQQSQLIFASGTLISDSTFEIEYTDASPDYGTINRDGSLNLELTGVRADGTPVSFGRWLFATPRDNETLSPAPHVADINPAGVPAYSADTTILIDGLSFLPASTVSMEGSSLKTTYVSPKQIRAVLPAALLSVPGTFDILVTNPAPGGGTYHYPFVVTQPVPTITSISPSTIAAGSVLLGITATGTGFDTSTVVTWNGIPRKPLSVTRTSIDIGIYPADIAAAGVAQIEAVNPSPGGGASAPVAFTITGTAPHIISQVIAPVAATTLVGDPNLSVVYAGLDSTDRAHPNSVTALDGATGQVVWSVPISQQATILTVSNDGQFLYVGKAKDSSITRISIATRAVDLTIPMGRNSFCPFHPISINVSPDNAHTIAVQRACIGPGADPTTLPGVTIYDDSVRRPVSSATSADGQLELTYGASSSALYGYNGYGSFYAISVDASGATNQAIVRNLPANPLIGPEILYLNKKLYATEGMVYDPVAQSPSASLPLYPTFAYSIAASRDGQTLYVLSGNYQTLTSFDLTRAAASGGVRVNGMQNRSSHLVRWGSDGLAFISASMITGGNVYLIRSDFVH